MAFIIKAVSNDGDWSPLALDVNQPESNVFSLIVGRNATGKSRLLRKIVSHYIFDQDEVDPEQKGLPPHLAHRLAASREIRLAPRSSSSPARVIAVSTGRHDRFPRPRRSASTTGNYHYIAPSEHGGPSSLTRSLTSIIGGLERTNSKYSDLQAILRFLDFEPIIEFKISIDPKFRSFVSDASEPQSRIHWMEVDLDQKPDLTRNYRDLEGLHHLLNYISSRKGINCEIDLRYGMRAHAELSPFKLMEGLDAGALRVSDLTLYTRSTKSKIKLSQASSGQQCMLTMILGIAGSIQDNSLICIDEPEISLHPEWQTDIIGQLQRAFNGYAGCHFIIATHSPQIVAGLTIENGFVLDLEDRELHRSEDYSNRSADFQLAKIFNAPGLNNEYLIRVSLNLLTKLSRRQELSSSDIEKIDMLSEIKKSLSSVDPVRHLVDQVLALR